MTKKIKLTDLSTNPSEISKGLKNKAIDTVNNIIDKGQDIAKELIKKQKIQKLKNRREDVLRKIKDSNGGVYKGAVNYIKNKSTK